MWCLRFVIWEMLLFGHTVGRKSGGTFHKYRDKDYQATIPDNKHATVSQKKADYIQDTQMYLSITAGSHNFLLFTV